MTIFSPKLQSRNLLVFIVDFWTCQVFMSLSMGSTHTIKFKGIHQPVLPTFFPSFFPSWQPVLEKNLWRFLVVSQEVYSSCSVGGKRRWMNQHRDKDDQNTQKVMKMCLGSLGTVENIEVLPPFLTLEKDFVLCPSPPVRMSKNNTKCKCQGWSCFSRNQFSSCIIQPQCYLKTLYKQRVTVTFPRCSFLFHHLISRKLWADFSVLYA